ncbi:hypothetical protein LAJ19_20125 (plasmid) [Deinococcus taeanensis]|nr:hypothetical protein [Deinococcus taeanensis]UBV45436.1 hypothetical protein LAJ19_20125 [Deinococcus taeanensis]
MRFEHDMRIGMVVWVDRDDVEDPDRWVHYLDVYDKLVMTWQEFPSGYR